MESPSTTNRVPLQYRATPYILPTSRAELSRVVYSGVVGYIHDISLYSDIQWAGIHILHYNTMLGRIVYTELLATGKNCLVKCMVKYFRNNWRYFNYFIIV